MWCKPLIKTIIFKIERDVKRQKTPSFWCILHQIFPQSIAWTATFSSLDRLCSLWQYEAAHKLLLTESDTAGTGFFFSSHFKRKTKISCEDLFCLFRMFANFIYQLIYPILFFRVFVGILVFCYCWYFLCILVHFSILSISCLLCHDGHKMSVPDEVVELKVGRKS